MILCQLLPRPAQDFPAHRRYLRYFFQFLQFFPTDSQRIRLFFFPYFQGGKLTSQLPVFRLPYISGEIAYVPIIRHPLVFLDINCHLFQFFFGQIKLLIKLLQVIICLNQVVPQRLLHRFRIVYLLPGLRFLFLQAAALFRQPVPLYLYFPEFFQLLQCSFHIFT